MAAAIQAGADSVYFGVGKLNMRSNSTKNFTLDDLAEIAKRCKQEDIKSYLTVNTIIYDEDIEEMQKTIDMVKETGISAIIASDISAIEYAREKDVDVHISTQQNISNYKAVKYFSQYTDVMVLARELTLEQVSKIVQQCIDDKLMGPNGEPVRIEVFAHGALCMAVSGKCYMSLHEYNYSANRGACLQTCRRSYTVTDNDNGYELEIDQKYIMSPRDLCTIGFLDRIIDAGVRVLKIEGRGRPPDYVKRVTACYDEAIKAYYDGTYSLENIKKWETRLSSVFNRGFWDGYYLGRKMGEWSELYGSNATRKKVLLGVVSNYFQKIGVAEITMKSAHIDDGDEIMIIGSTTGVYEGFANNIRSDDKGEVKRGSKGEIISIKVNDKVRRGDKFFKLVDTAKVINNQT